MPTKPKSSPIRISHVPRDQKQTILIAVTGLSPAVLTETVWTLAKHPSHPIIPDRIIVLTTVTGERKIKEQLFGPDMLWLTLRQQLLGNGREHDPRLDFSDTPDRIRIFTRRCGGRRIQLDRMDTLEETEAVGDCLVEEIWNWVGRPDTEVLASISGGFKTMSALLYAAMTVLGGPRDRILHVLVGDPFDGGTEPLFFWPEQPAQNLRSLRDSRLSPRGIQLQACDASLLLTDVQFPPLRELFGDYGFKKPPTFSALVSMSRNAVVSLPPPAVQSLVLRTSTLTVEVNGLPLPISKLKFYMLKFLGGCAQTKLRFDSARECMEAYCEFLQREFESAPVSRRHYLKERLDVLKADADGNDELPIKRTTKTLSDLKTKLNASGIIGRALAAHLEKGKHCLTVPAASIAIE